LPGRLGPLGLSRIADKGIQYDAPRAEITQYVEIGQDLVE
jgi:hypothetical protein